MPEHEDNGAEWVGILTELERELERVAQDPAAAVETPWRAPATAGPIPAELIDRARALVSAQEDIAGAIRDELTATARHLSALRSIPAAVASGGAVYLDVTG